MIVVSVNVSLSANVCKSVRVSCRVRIKVRFMPLIWLGGACFEYVYVYAWVHGTGSGGWW